MWGDNMLMTALENGSARFPRPINEPVRDFEPGSASRMGLKNALAALAGERRENFSIVDGRPVEGAGPAEPDIVPHDHRHPVSQTHMIGGEQIKRAIDVAARTRADWSRTSWSERAAIFLKAADLLATKYRDRLNAATMLNQSKTAHQAEIDSAAELIDFWRFNVAFASQLYGDQPMAEPLPGTWNRTDYRPLEGFVYAVTPFNFTAIAGNLPSAPALMGNTVLWKPASAARLSASITMDILQEAGLPDGVINIVFSEPVETAQLALADPRLAGIHFTGSTSVFNSIVERVGRNIGQYRNYPRLVGETGGKNFMLVHESADLKSVVAAMVRGAFEYQGQKCSAASRIFVPKSLSRMFFEMMTAEMEKISVGEVADIKNFMGAVIDARAFFRHKAVLDRANGDPAVKVVAGGHANGERGYFVEPTLLSVSDIASDYMRDEYFGPIASVFVYEDGEYEAVLERINDTSLYGLTGAVFANERRAITQALNALRDAAGNFYINDKPTGAVVGQQPFGGSRASGTNDKAGSVWNLIRWTSPRTIKETFRPLHDFRYAFMQES
jgi:1-pyrroline-5-carboxylate dehydrogenase